MLYNSFQCPPRLCALVNLAIDYIMEHVSCKVGIRVGIGSNLFTDLDYADDITLFVDKPEVLSIALETMEQESAKFRFRVSWMKTKIQNVGAGPPASCVTVNGHNVDGISEFTYLRP